MFLDQLLKVLGIFERFSPAVLTDKVTGSPCISHPDEVVIPLVSGQEVIVSPYSVSGISVLPELGHDGVVRAVRSLLFCGILLVIASTSGPPLHAEVVEALSRKAGLAPSALKDRLCYGEGRQDLIPRIVCHGSSPMVLMKSSCVIFPPPSVSQSL